MKMKGVTMTNDYKKFKEMTKPLKFRRIRRVWNTIRDVTINSYYDLLYLFNIVDKEIIKDHTCRECATLKSDLGIVTTEHVKCTVEVKVIEHLDIEDVHYKTKKGKLIPIYSKVTPTTEFLGMPVNPYFNFNDMGFIQLNRDIIRVPYFESSPVSYQDDAFINPTKVEIHEIDTSIVRSIRSRQTISKYYADLQDSTLETYYKRIVRSIEYYIDNINWSEYTRKEK